MAARTEPQLDEIDQEFEKAIYALSKIRSGIGNSREPSEVIAADCPDGQICTDGACAPRAPAATCEVNSDCPNGAFCDPASKTCIQTTVCQADSQCQTGFKCDQNRNTCTPAQSFDELPNYQMPIRF